MSIYYVYAYLRSKDSTTAPAGTPYYIGKGSNGRAYGKHGSINLPTDRSNISFLEENLSENKAFEIEKFLIAYYGRKDLDTGILLNRTNGGEGSSGHVVSPETKKKMSAKIGKDCPWYGKQQSEEHKQKRAMRGKKNPMYGMTGDKNPFFEKHHSEETKQKMSAAHKALPIVECPHCGKIGKSNAMKRWHFHNCKLHN